MKKLLSIAIVVLLAMMVWDLAFDLGHDNLVFDGDFDGGPLGALIGLVAGGAGLVIGALVLVVVGAILAVVFAGVGVVAIGALVVGAVALALMVSPLLLPLLVPAAVLWFFLGRSRRQRRLAA
jgi:hypothetical protein